MKRKANISIELQGLKCEHQVWPWPWPWPWIFKVKYGISYISAKSGPIAAKWKANISIELRASNVTNGFDLDLWILKVKCDFDLWPHTWPWIFMVKFWYSCISEWEGRFTLHKGGGSRSFMTMTMTIWRPRSGVWIYQIVTGVTSVVGVPSTHLIGTGVCIVDRYYMMTSSNGNIFRVTGHLCGEFTGPCWIPHTKASEAELWCFLWSAPE